MSTLIQISIKVPNPSIPNSIPRFAGTDGRELKDSTITIDDEGNISTTGLDTKSNNGILTGGVPFEVI